MGDELEINGETWRVVDRVLISETNEAYLDAILVVGRA